MQSKPSEKAMHDLTNQKFIADDCMSISVVSMHLFTLRVRSFYLQQHNPVFHSNLFNYPKRPPTTQRTRSVLSTAAWLFLYPQALLSCLLRLQQHSPIINSTQSKLSETATYDPNNQ
ncbi:hypothetical protein BaRGS_00032633 [Batillaria attramentaria]|uniref:Uncharacterized protein n=1 Tax=Batillaria attramentaria TaxID=370345 RepID=A0ABD0JN92_9CAEN